MDKLKVISKLDFFDELNENEMKELSEISTIITYPKSSILFYEDEIKDLFFTPQTSLFQLNLSVIKIICECIELDINIEYTDEFIKEYDSEDCIDLRVLVNAKKDIAPQFENYTQVFGDKHGYLNNLSILDLLFNEGPNTLNYLESQANFW